MGTATAERVGLEVDAEELAEAHGLVSAAVSASKVLDHLRCVRLTATGDGGPLFIEAQDLEVRVRRRVGEKEYDRPFDALVPSDRLNQILKAVPGGGLAIEATRDRVRIRAASSKFDLLAGDLSAYPEWRSPVADPVSVDASALSLAVQRVAYAADPRKYGLAGVAFLPGDRPGLLRMAAMSEGMFAEQEVALEGEWSGQTIVPVKGARLIARNFEEGMISVSRDGSGIEATDGETVVSSRLLEGRFPDYRMVLPASFDGKFEAGPRELLACLAAASVAATKLESGVAIDVAGGFIRMRSEAAEVGQSDAEMAVGYDGPAVSMLLSPKYLSEALGCLWCPSVSVEMNVSPGPPVILRTGDGFLCGIMQMGIKS